MPMDMPGFDPRQIRLSDRIMYAFELALEQEDMAIAEALARTLEMAMTRNTGGGEFVERRDYPPEMEAAMNRLAELQVKHRNAASR
ncbi:MAG: hypothetical protein KKA05_06335 [Alphaproteobacteria bacterium]|nr:hypothetical protein [Alphaproteobacteria bacterium]MBU0859203.1 hypothetical protein [Alphaproteobacteria bacterium]